MNILVYDCEIIKAILPDYKNQKPIEGIEYCAGWKDFENMGISVIGTYFNKTKELKAFVDSSCPKELIDNQTIFPITDFQEMLDNTDILVGFNNKTFDDNLIKANGFKINNLKNYDILEAIWEAVGIKAPFVFPTHAGYSLDETCNKNGLGRKSGDGANAAIDWQRGEFKKVIDYCLNDIKLTTDLLRAITENDGWINNPKTKIKLKTLGELK